MNPAMLMKLSKYRLAEMLAETLAEQDSVDREGYERGRAAGLSMAKLETEYGSFDALVQNVLATARETVRLGGTAPLREAIAAHDARYPPHKDKVG